MRRTCSRQMLNGRRTARHAFTLVEMLTVMAIIAILAGIIVAGSAYAQRQADRRRALATLERLKMAIEEYRVETGKIPDSSFNGDMNSSAWQNLASQAVFRRYVTYPDDFLDPWGRPFVYTNRGRFAYLLMSRGPDHTSPHDDITNEQPGD